MQNIDELEEIYKKAKSLVDSRQEAYRDGWKQEDLKDLYQNLSRKVRHLKFLADGSSEWDASAREACLDAMNYAAFSYYQLSQRRLPRIQIALDCPTNWLGLVQPLVDCDSVLANRVLEDDEYLNYFLKSSRPKIINNRKLGKDVPLGLIQIEDARTRIGDNGTVIAPDWGNSHRKTLEAFEDCRGIFGDENTIGVIQGTSDNEVEECLKLYGKKVAVGFDVGSKHEASELEKVARRALVISQISGRGRKIHLLGLTNPAELELYKGNLDIESISTGYPVLLAFLGRKLIPYQGRIKDISAYNYMNMKYMPIDLSTFRLIEENIKQLRNLLG